VSFVYTCTTAAAACFVHGVFNWKICNSSIVLACVCVCVRVCDECGFAVPSIFAQGHDNAKEKISKT
jgi:hypothetical protein